MIGKLSALRQACRRWCHLDGAHVAPVGSLCTHASGQLRCVHKCMPAATARHAYTSLMHARRGTSSSSTLSTGIESSVAAETPTANGAPSVQGRAQTNSTHTSPVHSHTASTSKPAAAETAIVVETNSTPNPDCMRFFSMQLSFLKPGFSVDFPTAAHAGNKSALAECLFELTGVTAVFIADEYITVRKTPEMDWAVLTPRTQEVIVRFAESGESVLTPECEDGLLGFNDDTEPEEDDDEVVLAVKELLSTRIRPLLRADGGNVRYIDMDDGTVYLLLEGACKSCPSSHITLKSGIERMLMHWIPEVVEAVEVSDEMAQDLLSEKKLRRKLKDEPPVKAQ